MLYKASAPGSMMLLGEHAVLSGKAAIVSAIDQRITVTLNPRSDNCIMINSDRFGVYEATLSKIGDDPNFNFILQAIKKFKSKLKTGFELYIHSDFAANLGLGSSAAVTVATLKVISSWLSVELDPIALLKLGRKVIKEVQHVGSGADVAASVFGGVVWYLPKPLTVEKFAFTYPITVLYCGYKTKTAEVIKITNQIFFDYPKILIELKQAIGQCVFHAAYFLRQKNWLKVGEMMRIQQGLMHSLGVNDVMLQDMVTVLEAHNEIKGAKISGSGLGDCVIGLGTLRDEQKQTILKEKKWEEIGVKFLPLSMTLEGVQIEEN